MDDYKLVIYADPRLPVGHFSVGLIGPTGHEKVVYGFYPKGGKVPAVDVEGEVRSDVERAQNDKVIEEEFTIPPEKAEKVRQYFDRALRDPKNYNIATNNCVDFAQGALDAAGVDKSVAGQFKEQELRQMGWGIGAGDYAISQAHRARGEFQRLYPDPSIMGEIGGAPGEEGFARIREAARRHEEKRRRGTVPPESGNKPDAADTDRDRSWGPGPGADARGDGAIVSPPGQHAAEARQLQAAMTRTAMGDVDTIMLKRPGDLTEAEVLSLGRRRIDLPQGDPEAGRLFRLPAVKDGQAFFNENRAMWTT